MAASRAQTPSRRRADQATSPLLFVSWGKKRARTGGAPGTGGTPPAPPCRRARDWANLGGEGPAGLIAELVLAGDVADYVRFRAVCRPWRRCTADPRGAGLDDRFLPWRWIMLDNGHAGTRRRRFLNLYTGECVRTDLPELAEHALISLTPEGLLLLLHEATMALRLLNPLTRQLTDLPPATTLPKSKHEQDRRWDLELLRSHDVYGAGLVSAGASTLVALSFLCWPTVLAVAEPGDESWTVVHCGFIASALPFDGRLYCATTRGVMVLDNSSGEQPPRLLTAAEPRLPLYFSSFSQSLHLVDNGGELMLVHRMALRRNCPQNVYNKIYNVYKVDLEAGILVPAKCFKGRAVFMGMCRAISVSVEVFPYVNADTIYFGLDYDESTGMAGYDHEDGSTEPDPWVGMEHLHPDDVVDCLSYCIQDTGSQLT
ncbi:hypothetical protein ACP70R_005511 [Stipagrostis hirtigluma subsp. patula]